MRWLLILALVLFSAYELFLGYMQDQLVYPGAFAHLAPATATLPPGVEQAFVETEPGVRVEGWFYPAADASGSAKRPAVLITHGNYETIDGGMYHAQGLHDLGLSVLLVEYRGYGRCAGKPTQTGILRDLLAWQTWLAARPEVDSTRIVYFGRSLGGAAAAQLAGGSSTALILESTFSSLDSMAAPARLGLPILLRVGGGPDQVLVSIVRAAAPAGA